MRLPKACLKIGALICSILALHVLLLYVLSWFTSLNRTEVGHLGSAVYFHETFRFDVFHVNPPLTRMIAGLPVRLTGPEYGWKSYSPRPQDRSEWGLGNAFIHANTSDNIRWYVFLARCSLIPIIVFGGYVGYRLASEIFGHTSGVVFLLLWTFSPLILGWGATICPDVCSAAIGIIGIYTFRRWLRTPGWWNAAVAGACLGLMLLTKTTWIAAFPLWFVIWTVWTFPYYIARQRAKTNESINKTASVPGWKQMVCLFFVAVYVINMGYAFDGSFRQLREYKFMSQTLSGIEHEEKSENTATGNRFATSWLGYVPVPLPAEFVQGFDTQRVDFERGMESYLCGEYSQHGWWNYYLYVIALKEPLGTLCLALIAITFFVFRSAYRANWRDEMLIAVPIISMLILISSQTGFSLHPRYLIPMLPLAYLWISRVGIAFTQKYKYAPSLAAVLLAWSVGSSLYYYPHSMSYFNELAGGPLGGPKYLLGSNVDWGQNAYFLKNWCGAHPEARPIRIAYSCAETPERLGIEGYQRADGPPNPGWYAIGVNELYGSSGQYKMFLNFTPVDYIGYSIYVYHLTENDICHLLKNKESCDKVAEVASEKC